MYTRKDAKVIKDKLNGFNKVRDRKYDHELKGFVYCGECGNKATLRCREEKRKNGKCFEFYSVYINFASSTNSYHFIHYNTPGGL